MQVRFINRERLTDYAKRVEEKACQHDGADITIFSFMGMQEVSYEKELKGETANFEETAKLSKLLKSTVVCGCVTDMCGHKRKSAVVAENGRLLGVSDMLNAVDGEVSSGATLCVYETKVGKMGVVVGEDILFYDVVKALCMCGSDFLVCPYVKADGGAALLIRAWAYSFGAPVFFCAEGYSAAADVTGDLVFSSPQSIAEVELTRRKEYHLVETRRRGVYKPPAST